MWVGDNEGEITHFQGVIQFLSQFVGTDMNQLTPNSHNANLEFFHTRLRCFCEVLFPSAKSWNAGIKLPLFMILSEKFTLLSPESSVWQTFA